MKTFGALILALVMARPALGQLRDLPEGADHPIVSRFAGSIIIGYDARSRNAASRSNRPNPSTSKVA